MDQKIKLKQRILEVLSMNDYTYQELSEYLGITQKELDKQFEEGTLEVRTLELISKALRIPLYSLFRDTDYEVNYNEELYYNIDIWGKGGIELRTKLKKDSEGNISDDGIEKLRKELKEKEKLLKECNKKLKIMKERFLTALLIVSCIAINGCGNMNEKKQQDTVIPDTSSIAIAYVCPCSGCPEVRESKPGKCPKCEMELVEEKK